MGEITKVVFTGVEGSGKSLEMAKQARESGEVLAAKEYENLVKVCHGVSCFGLPTG